MRISLKLPHSTIDNVLTHGYLNKMRNKKIELDQQMPLYRI